MFSAVVFHITFLQAIIVCVRLAVNLWTCFQRLVEIFYRTGHQVVSTEVASSYPFRPKKPVEQDPPNLLCSWGDYVIRKSTDSLVRVCTDIAAGKDDIRRTPYLLMRVCARSRRLSQILRSALNISLFGRSSTGLKTQVAVVLVTGLLFAFDSGAQVAPFLETGFERDVNRYRWIANGRFAQNVAGWNVSVVNRFVSDAFILFNNQLSFRDENQLSWQIHRPLGSVFSTRVQGRSAWYTQSRVFSQETLAGLRYSPGDYMWIEPAVGLAWDRRPGITIEDAIAPLRMDLGPAYGLRLNLSPPPIDDYVLQMQVDGGWQVINPRRGHALRLSGTAERLFERTRLSSAFGFSSYRRDAYQAASFLNRGTPTDRLSETVEATTSDTLFVRLHLDTPILKRFRLISNLDLSTNNRFIRTLRAAEDALYFDTDFRRRTFEGELGLQYTDRRVQARVALEGGAEVEQRQLTNRDVLPPAQATQKSDLLQQADYDQGYVSIQVNTRAQLGNRTSLTFDGATSILRHDTPETNLDDRDEQYHNAQIGIFFQLNRHLLTDVRMLGTYYHTVYINAERSAENNVQRSLRLRPTVRWVPSSRSTIRFSSEIRATYTVDDFVLPGRRPTDQSARELRYDGEFEHDFGRGVRLFINASRSDLHLGRLLWNQFAEIPFDTLRTYSGWIHLQAGRHIVADIGFRLYIRRDFDRNTIVRYPRIDADGNSIVDETGNVLLTSITRPGRSWIEQIGPTCIVTWPMRNASRLRLEGWLNIQHIRQRLYGSLPDTAADRIRHAGRRGTRKIIPNVALTMTWRI